MNRRIASLCSTTIAALSLATMTPSIAQTTAPVSSLPWNPSLGQVVLGRGMEIHPNQISVVGGVGLANSPYDWQQDSQTLRLLDYTSLTDTMQSLNLNAWAEANGFLGSGKFSVNWSQFSAFQGNHRHWEVDALYYKTAFLPAPQLTPAAQKMVSSPQNFEAKYGNYAVTGITYRQRIAVTWDTVFNSSVSQSQFDAAISGSYGMFSGGASVSSFFQQLQSFAQTTVTVTVEGQKGGPVFSAAIGSASDLANLIATVQQLLNGWSVTPADPSKAGIIDTVYLTPWTAIPSGPPVVPDFSPNQTDLTNAIEQYVYLDQSRTRLQQINSTDTNLNPKLKAYIASKLKEVTATRAAAKTYVQSLTNNNPPASPPDLSFQFDDPDVVRWHVVEYVAYTPTSYYPIIEIYSNARVMPYAPSVGGGLSVSHDWSAGLRTITASEGVFNALTYPSISEASSYTTDLDPVTGIPHRFVSLSWECGPGPMQINLVSENDQSQNYYNATDWDGWPAPQILIEPSVWRRVDPDGVLLGRLVGEVP